MRNNNWIKSWKQVLSDSKFRISLIVTVFMLVFTAIYFTSFLDFVEARPGVILPDPLLVLIEPRDLTWIIFSIIYISVVVAFIYLAKNPRKLVIALQAYILLVIARTISMYLIPFDPPVYLIVLEDPFVQSMSSSVLTKDLFFSGHTSTLFLLFLSSDNKILKALFFAATIIVGISVLWQHVHYSIDVFAAPFYSYTCYRASLLLNQKVRGFRDK